jgi:hypothetical protein
VFIGRTDPVPLELKGDYMGLGRFQMEVRTKRKKET